MTTEYAKRNKRIAKQALANEHQELGGHPFSGYEDDRSQIESLCPRC